MTVPTVNYAYGSLTEILNLSWPSIYEEPVEHTYVVVNSKVQRNEWHVHKESFDRYLLLQGELEVVLYDNRPQSPTADTLGRYFLHGVGNPGCHGLRIPPGVWHTFRSISDGFMLMNNKFPPYRQDNPDKYSVAFSESGVDFEWDA